jgi:hypothetical protein
MFRQTLLEVIVRHRSDLTAANRPAHSRSTLTYRLVQTSRRNGFGLRPSALERNGINASVPASLVSLATRWDELNNHVQASGQLVLPF